jgi:two-component system response regulator MtrA
MDGDLQVSPPIDRLMQGAGLRTIRATDGPHALDAVHRERPDVLLLDLMKPALRGFDVLHALGLQDTRPHIVVLAAREHEEAVTRAFELGADDYVTRPFTPQDLLVRVTRLMR